MVAEFCSCYCMTQNFCFTSTLDEQKLASEIYNFLAIEIDVSIRVQPLLIYFINYCMCGYLLVSSLPKTPIL